MNPGAPTVLRRLLSWLPAVVLSAVAVFGGAVALGSVTRSDLAAAEESVDVAAQHLATARSALQDALESRTRLADTIVRLDERRRSDQASAVVRETTLRSRVATLYMSAGARGFAVVVGDVTSFSTRVAYLAAVTEDDRSAVNRFVLSAAELDLLRISAEEQQVLTEARIEELTVVEAERAAALDVARAALDEVQEAWDRQEAARIAAEEAELRRQEAALAAQIATATTRPAGSTTTTTRPSYGYVPGAGVEQWRPIVAEVFADWGLDQTKCATRNGIEFCVSGQVDNALRIMRCESNGIPFAENPHSGAAGLFQNLPYYWQSRVDRVRTFYSSMSNLPAGASIWNPEHNTVVAAMLVYESREAILGNRGGAGVSPAVWPEFNWARYATSGYGYSAWGKGPNPWGHWSCGAQLGIYDSAWVHPWAIQQTAP